MDNVTDLHNSDAARDIGRGVSHNMLTAAAASGGLPVPGDHHAGYVHRLSELAAAAYVAADVVKAALAADDPEGALGHVELLRAVMSALSETYSGQTRELHALLDEDHQARALPCDDEGVAQLRSDLDGLDVTIEHLEGLRERTLEQLHERLGLLGYWRTSQAV